MHSCTSDDFIKVIITKENIDEIFGCCVVTKISGWAVLNRKFIDIPCKLADH